MVAFVAVRREVRSDRLAVLLDVMQRTYATVEPRYTGWRRSRVFQRLNEPTSLLSISEWDGLDDFERFQQSAEYRAHLADCVRPPEVVPLVRLSLSHHMARRAAVMGGAIVTTLAGTGAPDLEAYLTDEDRRMTLLARGIVSHEVYRGATDASRLIVLHTWESLEALEAFRAQAQSRHEAATARYGARVERFTGGVFAEGSMFAR